MIFPKNFIWGAATASYQIEGGINDDGRGSSIWDVFNHIPGNIINNDNGDIACDHYHRYREDVQIMKEMGLKGYRFSIAWSRVLPDGKRKVNQKGIDFYNNLVDELLKNNIEPMATLYHWDLPQALQDTGGWGNRDTIEYFNEYANRMFEVFGDRVKKWITHNEPWVVAYAGNYIGRHAPGIKDLSLAVQITHHLILSHAKVVESYKKLNNSDGSIGITLNLYPIHPASDMDDDKNAVLLADDFYNNWFLDPVFKGKYPERLFGLFTKKLKSPIILDNDLDIIKNNYCDFLGINYYFRRVVKKSNNHQILNFEEIKPDGSLYTDMDWEIYPQGLYELLINIKEKYNNPVIYITENGAAFKDDQFKEDVINDDDRLNFLKTHFKEAYQAICNGVKLDGYYVWSLMDNFEWAFGYSKRFGLIYIDYETQKRIWKKSALWYKGLINQNGILE